MTDAPERRRHLVTHLGIGADPHGEGAALVYCPPDVCATTGVPHLGVVGMMVDMLGGVLASLSVTPDIVVTTDLTVVRDPTLRPRSVTGIGEVVRRGRSSVTMEIPLIGDDGAPVGWSAMSSAVLPSRGEQFGRAARLYERLAREPEAGVVRQPIAEVVGIEPADGADGSIGVQVEIRPDVSNPLGMLHGGVVAMLVDAASVRTANAVGIGDPDAVVTEEMTIRYVAANREGPIRAVGTVLSTAAGAVSSRIEARDLGSGRLTALATTRAVATT